MLLGQGNDSHLASLFPGALGVEAAFDPRSNALVCTMTPPPGMKPALPRLSLTLAALLDSRRIVIA
ncbi:MAG: 6-phosphogluconolactonase, partial [Methylibium sp.]|nr:6-phosphogluconolactonase [Methylibium sp.]